MLVIYLINHFNVKFPFDFDFRLVPVELRFKSPETKPKALFL